MKYSFRGINLYPNPVFVIITVSGSSLCYLSDFLYLYEGLFIESLLIIAIVLKTISCILYFTVSHRKNPYPVVALYSRIS